MDKLIKSLSSTFALSDELRNYLDDIVEERHIPPKTLLLRPGQVCRHLYFVNKGMFRTYYTKRDKNISSAFSIEGDICVSLDSFFNQKYSVEGIEALENSLVYYITYEQYQYLNLSFPDFNTISRLLLERCIASRERRHTAMWMQPAVDRYNWSLQHMPMIHQRAMAKHIASYLGITEVTLSQIKNSASNKA